MKISRNFLHLGVICAGLITAAPARADTIVLQDRDRDIVSDWVIYNNKGCPAGTAWVKRDRMLGGLTSPSYRCVAPSGSKVIFYKPGTTLPTTVTYTELPPFVIDQLPPPPSGQMYVTSDNNVYLIDRQTRTIVDAVPIVGAE